MDAWCSWPFASPLDFSLALRTQSLVHSLFCLGSQAHSLAPPCSLCSRALLRSFIHLLAHSLASVNGFKIHVYESIASISGNFNPVATFGIAANIAIYVYKQDYTKDWRKLRLRWLCVVNDCEIFASKAEPVARPSDRLLALLAMICLPNACVLPRPFPRFFTH